MNRSMRSGIFFFLFLITIKPVFAQSPQLIPYQAIARDIVGNPVINQNIGLRFSIHDQTINGTTVWQEEQTVLSNNLGIIVTAIGGTTTLTNVDWGSGAKFLQVEMDIAGGTSYLDMGTQQMMSVPYALYAETSGTVINNGGSGGSFNHWIGEYFQGGIICHLWKDAQGIEHGLILNLNDETLTWGLNDGGGFTIDENSPLNSSTSFFDGENNFNSQLQVPYSSGSALDYVSNLNENGYTDWYIPAVNELNFVWQNLTILNDNLGQSGNEQLYLSTYYLTSTLFQSNNLIYISKYGYDITSQSLLSIIPSGGGGLFHVRAFRKF